MKAVVHLLVDEENNSMLLDKIVELGYTAMHVWTSPTYQVYMVDMDVNDLMILKLAVPCLKVDGI